MTVSSTTPCYWSSHWTVDTTASAAAQTRSLASWLAALPGLAWPDIQTGTNLECPVSPPGLCLHQENIIRGQYNDGLTILTFLSTSPPFYDSSDRAGVSLFCSAVSCYYTSAPGIMRDIPLLTQRQLAGRTETADGTAKRSTGRC